MTNKNLTWNQHLPGNITDNNGIYMLNIDQNTEYLSSQEAEIKTIPKCPQGFHRAIRTTIKTNEVRNGCMSKNNILEFLLKGWMEEVYNEDYCSPKANTYFSYDNLHQLEDVICIAKQSDLEI